MASDIGTYVSGTAGTTGREPFEDGTGRSNTIPGDGQVAPNAYEGGLGSAGVVGEGHHKHHHHHHEHQAGAENTGSTGQIYGANAGTEYNAGGVDARSAGNEPYTNAPSTNPTNDFGTGDRTQTDRVGNLGQDSALYERSGESGPATTGAAGTDRFDTDRSDRHGSGGIATGEPGAPASQQTDAQAKAASALHTSDTEFTNRDPGSNIGSKFDAYRDDAGAFQNNTSGPSGNTALTGREGTIEKNPVAQAKGETGATGNTTAAEAEGEKKPGLVQKIKDML